MTSNFERSVKDWAALMLSACWKQMDSWLEIDPLCLSSLQESCWCYWIQTNLSCIHTEKTLAIISWSLWLRVMMKLSCCETYFWQFLDVDSPDFLVATVIELAALELLLCRKATSPFSWSLWFSALLTVFDSMRHSSLRRNKQKKNQQSKGASEHLPLQRLQATGYLKTGQD